jgi:hypothetical protein
VGQMDIPPLEMTELSSVSEASRVTIIELGVHTIPFRWDADVFVVSQNEVCVCVCVCDEREGGGGGQGRQGGRET